MRLVLIILLVLLLAGALPAWPYSAGWGYPPVFVILIVILILALCGYL